MSVDAFLAARSLFGERATSFGLLEVGAQFVFAGVRVEPTAEQAFTKTGPNRYRDNRGRTFQTSRKSACFEVKGGR